MVISDDSISCLNSLQALDVVKNSGLDVPFIIYAATMNHRVATTATRERVHDYLA